MGFSMNILIVDNIKETYFYIGSIITKYFPDFRLDYAHSYDSAIDKVSQSRFDMLILDYELDEQNEKRNGITLGKYISSLDGYSNIPVVFETSYPEHIFTAVNSLNCMYYLVKPFRNQDIIDMIHKTLMNVSTQIKLTFHNSVGIQTMININDIVCIKSFHHDILLYTPACEYSFINYNLSDIITDSLYKLIRCHKSYIINPDYIVNIDKSNRIISISLPYTKLDIPIGRKYSDSLYNAV